MIRKSVAPPLYCFTILLSLTLASWGVDPQFEAVHSYRSNGWQTSSVAVGDVNLDGKLDVVVANPCRDTNRCSKGGTVGVLLGIGDGTFQTVHNYSSGGQFAVSVALGDVNGDGHPDIVVANTHPNTVGVLLGNGHGKFQTASTYSSGGQSLNFLALGDVNDDGKLDLLVADGCISSNDCSSGGVGVLLGNGDGTFQTAQLYDTGGFGPQSLAVADVNSDGRLDVVVANICRINDGACQDESVVSVLLGNGDGTFQTAQTYNSGGFYGSSVAVADVNGDNKLDLLVTNRCIQRKSDCFNDGTGSGVIGVLLGNGDGTFQNTERYRSGGYGAGAIAVADLSHDGTLDIVVANICRIGCANGPAVIGVLSGNGDGTFQKAQRYGAGGYYPRQGALAVADVNGDKKLDLVVATECVPEFICNHGGGVGILLARYSTTTILTSNLNPSIYGESVALTAKVISEGPSAPQGTVTFKSGNNWLGKVTLNGGVAMLTTTKLPVGTLSITARYNGDIPSMKSTSETLVQVVQ